MILFDVRSNERIDDIFKVSFYPLKPSSRTGTQLCFFQKKNMIARIRISPSSFVRFWKGKMFLKAKNQLRGMVLLDSIFICYNKNSIWVMVINECAVRYSTCQTTDSYIVDSCIETQLCFWDLRHPPDKSAAIPIAQWALNRWFPNGHLVVTGAGSWGRL